MQITDAEEQAIEAAENEYYSDNDGAMVSQSTSTGGLKKNYLYLDTCTTEDQMVNPAYLSKIHQVGNPLHLHTNAGSSSTSKKGYLGSQLFWLDRMGIANVVSLKSLEERFHVKYDSKTRGGSFICKTPQGEVVFTRCPKTSFPFVNLDEENENAGVLMVQTVREKYAGYTRREVERAIQARKLQARAGHPSEAVFKKEVSRKSESSLFRDCPVTVTDISNAHAIFGPSKPCRQGKWVRPKPDRVEPDYVSIPAEIVEINKQLVLVADVMFVNGLPFFLTMSRKIRFLTVQYVPHRTAAELANVIKQVIKLYRCSGFNPTAAL